MKRRLLILALPLCFTSVWAQKDCDNAHVLTSGCPVTVDQNEGIGEPENLYSCIPQEIGSYWFTFTPAVSGSFEMLVVPLGSVNYDFALYAWSCPDFGNAALIACNYEGVGFSTTGISSNPLATFGLSGNEEFEPTVNLQAGIPYFLLLDNFDGDGAGFTIEFAGTAFPPATAGEPPVIVSNSPLACPPDSAQTCQRVCANTSITYEVQDLPDSVQVTWEVSGADSFFIDGNQVTVEWGAPGEGEVVATVVESASEPIHLQAFCGQSGIQQPFQYALGKVTAVGGTQPYALTFAASGTTLWTLPFNQGYYHNLSFLQDQVYSVTVTDAAGKTAFCQFTPTVDPNDCWVSLFPNSLKQPSDCNACNGGLEGWIKHNSPSFGNSTFFNWSNGNTGISFNFCVGTYTVTVTNNNGCSSSETIEFTCGNATCPTPTSLCVEIQQPPKAVFSATPSPVATLLQICQGQEVFFENTSQDAATYAWIFGDGITSAQASPSHAYLLPGTFTAALIARNDCFCADTAFLTIEVLPANLPDIDCVGSVCEGDVVTYSTDAGCGSFDWSVSGNAAVLGGGGAGDDFITVEWQTGLAEGWISLQTSGCGGSSECAAANVVPIAILSDQVQIQGLDKVCDGQTAEYFIPDFQGTEIGWQVSGAGTIVSPSGVGGGTSRIVVEWSAGLPNPQQVIVWFDNCFLGCSGQDTLLVNIRNEFYVEGGIEFCQNDAGQFSARNTVTDALVPCHWQVLNASGSAVWSSAAPVSSASISFDFPGGNYTVRAVPASLSSFCNGSFDVPIHVFANPAAVGGIVGDLEICPGEAYTYAAQGLGDNGFEWTIQNGSVTSTATGNPINVTWVPTSVGMPRILTVSQISANGLLCASEPFSLSVSEFPPVSISGTPKVCLEETGNYSASPIQNIDYQWTISPPDAGAIISGQGSASISVRWNKPGMAAVQVTTCVSTASFPLEILPLPEPLVLDGEVCFGQTLQVAASQPFSTYVWKNAGGATVSTLPSPSLGAGNYTLSVTDANGCAGTAIFKIVQHPLPNITLDVPFQPNLCPGGMLDVYVTTLASGLDFQWNFNGSPVPAASGGNSPHLVATQVGNYQLVATDPHGCTVSRSLGVASCEDVGGICEFGSCVVPDDPCDGGICLCGGICPDCDPCPPGCVLLGNLSFEISPAADCSIHNYVNISTAFDPASLTWNFGDPGSGSQNSSTQLNPSHAFPAPGFYLVKLRGNVQSANIPGAFCPDIAVKDDTILAVADFAASAACPGSPLNFTDRTEFLPFATLTNWHWDFGDPVSGSANFSTDQNPAHIYASPGSYLVKLTVTVNSPSGVGGGGGCQTSFSKNVTVNPLPTVSFTPPTAGCGGTAFQFNSSASAGVAKYAWDFGDPASGSANTSVQANPLHVFEAAGTYPVGVTVTNAYGCTASATAPVQVVANTLTGSISFSQPPPICAGDSIVLTASASPSGGGGVSFLWSNGSTSSHLTIKQSAIYKVTLTDAFGCKFTPPPAIVDVLGEPNAVVQAVEFNEYGQPVAIFTNDYEACEGDPVNLQIIGELGYTYAWSDGSTSDVLTFTEDKDNLLPTGSHTFAVTVTNSATGCTSAEGISVEIHPKPVVAIASNPTGFICENTPATLSVISPQPATNYTWNTGEPGTSIAVISGGKYFAVAANSFGCTAKSNEIEIQPAPGASKFPLGCLTRCLPTEICLPDLPTVVSWQWYLNGAPVPPAAGGNLPSPSFTQSGDYQVEMTDLYGCVSLSGILTLDLYTGYGTVGGQVFFDVNQNGVIDPADTTVSGIPIILTTSGGAPLDTMSSNPTGNFIFPDILSTAYSLQLDTASLPVGWAAVLQNADFELVGCEDEAAQDFLLTQICVPTTSSLTLQVCSEDSASYAGEILPVGATEIFILTGEGGCDSTVTVTVAPLPHSVAIWDVEICSGETFEYIPGIELPPGDYVFAEVNQHGCFDTIFLTVGGFPTDFVSETLTTCPGTTAEYDGVEIAPGDTVEFVFENGFGCDSIVQVSVVALLATDTTFVLFESCGQQAMTFNGQEIQPGEQATFTFSSWQGCDSTVTVSVTALPASDTTFVLLEACPGQSVSFNGQTLLPGQQFNWLGVNEFGCDSVVAVNVLALQTSDTTFVNLEGCEGETVNFNGQEIPAGGQASFVFQNWQGCDSLVFVSVAANPASQTTLQLSACAGETVEFNGQQLSPGEQANWLGVNQFGCDSLVSATVELLPHVVSEVNVSACKGQIVEIQLGAAFQLIYVFQNTQDWVTQINSAGCIDSFLLTVTAFEPSSSQLQLTACPGSTVEYLGVPLSPGDSAVVVFANQWGCDSTVTVTVLAAPQDTVFDFPLVCIGDSTTVYNGQNFSVGDEAVFHFTNSAGCDSIVKIKVLQAPVVDFWATTEPVCFGSNEGYIEFWNHATITEPFEFSVDGGQSFHDLYKFTGLAGGHYEIAARDRIGCIFEDEIFIPSLPPLLVQAPGQVSTCVDSIQLQFSVSQPSLPFFWQWQSPAQAGGGISTDSIFWATLPGDYLLTVANECDTVKKNIEVRLEEDSPLTKVYVPNSFSPNGDGFNDCFRGYVAPDVQLLEYQLEIFDRWGNHVFGTREVEGCWDGKFRERWMDPAVLVWYVKMKVVNCRGEVEEVFKEGGVTIVR